MEHDYIVTCGDSFTEGHPQGTGIPLGDPLAQTWPKQLAQKYNVDFDNLAFGGSSNTVIAMQPIQEHISDKIMSAKNPLLLFCFTVHGRWTYFHPFKGRLHSISHVNLDHYTKDHGVFVWHQKNLVANTLLLGNYYNEESWKNPWHVGGGFDAKEGHTDYWRPHYPGDKVPSKNWVGPWLYATHQAIRMVLNYKKLMPHATIMWGFLHEQKEEQCFGEDIFTIVDQDNWRWGEDGTKILYPGLEHCFNKYTKWLPMERCVINMDLRISEDDRHPNLEGIKNIGDAMANCIEGIHNERIVNDFDEGIK
jgi:hypothetical protein